MQGLQQGCDTTARTYVQRQTGLTQKPSEAPIIQQSRVCAVLHTAPPWTIYAIIQLPTSGTSLLDNWLETATYGHQTINAIYMHRCICDITKPQTDLTALC